MIRKIRIFRGDDKKPEETGGKRLNVNWAPGRALFMVSFPFLHYGYLTDLYWAVYDFGSGVMVGIGKTKDQAINTARRSFSNRLGLRNKFIDGRAKLHAYDRWVEAEWDAFQSSRREFKAPTANPKRKRVFLKGGGKCVYCKVDIELGGDWQMDHYISRANGGSDHHSNLVPACKPCNQSKREMNGDEFSRLVEKKKAAA